MTKKSAKRFLDRNKWNVCKPYMSNAFWKRVRTCKRVLGEIKYRQFSLAENPTETE